MVAVMSGFMTRWVVLEEHVVDDADRDADGTIHNTALERWVCAICDSFLDRCAVLQKHCAEAKLALRTEITGPRAGFRLGRPDTVVVSASAAEVHPDSFTIAVRVRGTHETVVNTTCVVSLEAPATGSRNEISDDIRDELIALAHAAKHFN